MKATTICSHWRFALSCTGAEEEPVRSTLHSLFARFT